MKGKSDGKRVGMIVAGNPNVFKEAGVPSGTRRKKGGRVKVNTGFMTGGGVRPRLDRPGRKRGGRAGADTSPLSTANKAYAAGGGVMASKGASANRPDKAPIASSKKSSMSADGSSNPMDTAGGTPAD